MKVYPFKIPKPQQQQLVYQEDNNLVFYSKLHQHLDIQLSYIVEGEGSLIVGDTINEYKQGDFIVIGSNLPHVFRSDTMSLKKSYMLSLFFTEDSFGKEFFKLEILDELKPFFKKATNGFKITSDKSKLESLFLNLKKGTNLSRFIILLEFLQIASKANYSSLSSFIYDKNYTDTEGKRLSDVFEFTISNFDKNLNLEAVAEVASMTKNAFCKYFKKRTNKTYFRFLNELRIEHSCKLLRSKKELTIADIAIKSGFNNLSNFNRQFKTIKKLSPTEYRKTL